MSSMEFYFSIITKAGDGHLTKELSLSADGILVKDSSQCKMSRGDVRRVSCSSMRALSEVIRGLSKDQALCLGIYDAPHVRVKSKDTITITDRAQGYRTRTKSEPGFGWPSEGALLLIDYDYHDEARFQAENPEDVHQLLCSISPVFEGAAYVGAYSTSSYVFHKKTGNRLDSSHPGMHVYYAVERGADIEGFARWIEYEMWLKGHGYIRVSKSGAALERVPIDLAVFSHERLIFDADPVLARKLSQRRPAPVVHEGIVLDLSCLPPHDKHQISEAAALKQAAKEKAAGTIHSIKERYIENRSVTLAESAKMSVEEAKEKIRTSLETSVLPPEWPLIFDNGDERTVGQVLENADRFANWTLQDPLEPGEVCKAKLYVNADGSVLIHSFKHGERLFQLQRRAIETIAETLTSLIVADPTNAFLDWIVADACDLFNRDKQKTVWKRFLQDMKCVPNFSAKEYAQHIESLCGNALASTVDHLKEHLRRYVYLIHDGARQSMVADLALPPNAARMSLENYKNTTKSEWCSDSQGKKRAAAELWLQSSQRKTAQRAWYFPGGDRLMPCAEGQLYNTFTWPLFVSDKADTDPSAINDFLGLALVITDASVQFDADGFRVLDSGKPVRFDLSEAYWLVMWCAYLIQYPSQRAQVVPLIVSEAHGNGRDTFAEILMAVCGAWNCSTTDSTTFFGDMGTSAQFTDYLSDTIFCVISEIGKNDGSKITRRTGVDDRVRAKLTNTQLEVNAKYGLKDKNRTVFTSFLLLTNYPDALRIPKQDRRIQVLTGIADTDRIPPSDYWAMIRSSFLGPDDHCRTALRSVWSFLNGLAIENYDQTRAVMTPGKQRMMDEADHSPVDDALDELIEKGAADQRLSAKALIAEVNRWLQEHGYQPTNARALGAALKRRGHASLKSNGTMHYPGLGLR